MVKVGSAKQAGAEKKTVKYPEIKELLTALIERHKAGSPTDTTIYWISLKPFAIAKIFEEQHHLKISNGLVKRLLKELGYSYRKQSKQLATGSYAHPDAQFKIICSLNGFHIDWYCHNFDSCRRGTSLPK